MSEVLSNVTCDHIPEGDSCGLVVTLIEQNAKLREQGAQLFDKTLELGTENAKLRELARKMWKPFCWAQSGYEVCLSDEEDKEIRDIARELGIEVDE